MNARCRYPANSDLLRCRSTFQSTTLSIPPSTTPTCSHPVARPHGHTVHEAGWDAARNRRSITICGTPPNSNCRSSPTFASSRRISTLSVEAHILEWQIGQNGPPQCLVALIGRCQRRETVRDGTGPSLARGSPPVAISPAAEFTTRYWPPLPWRRPRSRSASPA
jgi:hypothetical protein